MIPSQCEEVLTASSSSSSMVAKSKSIPFYKKIMLQCPGKDTGTYRIALFQTMSLPA